MIIRIEAAMTKKKRVIALGFFDGVHIGHSALIEQVIKRGTEKNLVPSIITFDAHPQSLLSGETIPLINSPEDRSDLIRRTAGINEIIFLHFDIGTAAMPWDKFINHLVDEFGARHLIAGHDFRFGHEGNGNSELLAQKCQEIGIGCDIIPEVMYDGVKSSSTYIRGLIADGNIKRANAFLGHPHVLTDVVRYGYHLGRTLGTPTINMLFPAGVLIPAFGVYATKVYPSDGSNHIGVTNIGARPTIGNTGKITAETHILNYQGNLYGHRVRIEFHEFLRPETKFDDITKLKEQIQADCSKSLQYFSDVPKVSREPSP